jgi:hypothetical protein
MFLLLLLSNVSKKIAFLYHYYYALEKEYSLKPPKSASFRTNCDRAGLSDREGCSV